MARPDFQHSRLTVPVRQGPPAPWGWACVGIFLGCLLAIVVWAPARWLTGAVSDWSASRVVLSDAHGTVWNGSAQLTLGGGQDSRDSARLPGRFYWRLRPGLREWQLSLRADCCAEQAQNAHLSPGWNGWTLRLDASDSYWPAEALVGLGTPWNTVQPQGQIHVSTAGLQLQSALQRIRMDGVLTLELQDLSSRLSTLQPLGSYRLDFQGGPTTQLLLRTQSGSLQLQGQGQWAEGRLHFEGDARADADHEAELFNLLNIIGRRDGARSVITLG